MGNVAKESVEDAIKETVEILPNDNETEDEVEEVKESKKKSKKVNEDTVGFKNIFEGTTSKNVLEEDEK